MEKILTVVGLVLAFLYTGNQIVTYNDVVTSPLPTAQNFVAYSFIDEDIMVTVNPVDYVTEEKAKTTYDETALGAEIHELNLKEYGYEGFLYSYSNQETISAILKKGSVIEIFIFNAINADSDLTFRNMELYLLGYLRTNGK